MSDGCNYPDMFKLWKELEFKPASLKVYGIRSFYTIQRLINYASQLTDIDPSITANFRATITKHRSAFYHHSHMFGYRLKE